MRALVYAGPGQAELRDVPRPVARPGEALLRMRLCGLCGTDVGIHAGTHPRATAPLVLGHEFVAEIAADTPRFMAGQRVVAYPLISCGTCHPCRTGQPHVCASLRLVGIDRDGGMAEWLALDETVLFPVPDDMDDATAALVEPLAVALRAVERSGAALTDSAVVVGAGPIGLLTALLLRRAGVSRLFVSDVDPARLELAARMGATPINVRHDSLLDRVLEATNGDGADVVFECAGAAEAVAEITRIARPGGTICMASIHKAAVPVSLIDVNFRELTLIGSRVYTREQFRRAVDLARDLAEDLRSLVTHVVPLGAAAEVFAMQASPDEKAVKILVDCRS
ncbi:zinc-dependent alcohol dehydrogenase [Limimaricola pyoseonensis]|uniref:Threonine dehydrogenase n=1 Tax=Limimaricola pyoseonensis TaxID=521013 RepID=A0A1G6ZN27_9RHOB|nr:alcohol dehydrogenase catalytic domain-containing protein [Limimaricola pyoseonensis]SDE03979.1 Threonine dehydrogenase [Limimaricola pyoseonensis]